MGETGRPELGCDAGGGVGLKKSLGINDCQPPGKKVLIVSVLSTIFGN
jgi:hypothetical protein